MPPSSNAMTPMSTLPGCASMKASAARFAAASRLGATSVAAMLPETSTARTTVPLAWDTGTDTVGPATASARTAMPAMVHQAPASLACPEPAATPAAASAAVRRRAMVTAAPARNAATSRPRTSSAGSAMFMRACAGC